MNLFYALSPYNSHNRAGKAYRSLIRECHSLVQSVKAADLVILHIEPNDYGAIYESYSILKERYVIAYCVWEADDLPDAYKRSLSYVQEIWAPSHYCKALFEKYHPRVLRMPHVIDRDMVCPDRDRAIVLQKIGHNPDYIYYLMITRMWDKRKNTGALINAFVNLRKRMPDARLIVKASAKDRAPSLSDPRIIFLCEQMGWSQITALYECADVYVSPHHSEGWGLTMSDALLFRKPAIATGYSGNLDFMSKDNSFLLDFREEFIRSEDIFGHFTARMKWAYPSQKDLEEKLLFLYELRDDRRVSQEVHQKAEASADIGRFAPAVVGQLVRNRLDELERGYS
jgi:glycosyltransferase involved in cell wall biosynthesis